MKRNESIDMLRGFSMLMIMLTHASSYFLGGRVVRALWNMSQFSVAVFIFCSFYLLFKKGFSGTVVSYLKKRFLRLFVPYAVFLLFFFPLNFFYDRSFMNLSNMFRYLTLTTKSNDLSWLVLLFLMLTPIGLFIKMLGRKHTLFLYSLTVVIFLISFIFLFYKPPIHFKFIMWLPWSLVILFTYFFVEYEENPRFLISATMTTGLLFAGIYLLNSSSIHRLFFYDNKYPPNIYLLSYGIFWICLLIVSSKHGIFNVPIVKPFLNYLSRYSYPLYFIHFFILHYLLLFNKKILLNLNWWGLFGTLLFGSIVIQLCASKLIRR